MSGKKTPQRMCVGCREMKEKRELIRIVRTEDGAVLDSTGKKPGRGAYLCLDPQCLARAEKSRALERALNVKIAKEIYDNLKEALNDAAK